MQNRPIVAAALLAVMIAACGGGSATQVPGGNGGNGGTPTDDNGGNGGNGGTPTDDNGGNGGNGGGGIGNAQFGTGHVDITGPASASVDLFGSPVLSHFGGTDNTVLYLTPANAEGALALTWQGGEFTAVYTSTEITVSGIECTTSNLQMGATSAKGSFECPSNIVVLISGASAENAGFKGSFDVHG